MKTLMTFILDESGSMGSQKEATISGFNEFIESQRDKSLGECQVTLVKFNSTKVDIAYSDIPIDDVVPLTRESYQPDALTPLYDAIAQAIKETEEKYSIINKVLSKMAGKVTKAASPAVILIIMTDGQENDSRQYSRQDIFKMISEKKKEGWAFVFLGANQDSWETTKHLGIPAGSTVNYVTAHTGRAFAGIAHATSDYRAQYQALTKQTAAADEELVAGIRNLAESYFAGKKTV